MKSTAEVAKSLGISTRRVTKLIEDGVLKAEKIGRSWFIDEASLDAFAMQPRKSGRPRKDAADVRGAQLVGVGNDAEQNAIESAAKEFAEDECAQQSASTQRPQVMTGAQALIFALEDAGVELIFGLPGAQVLDIYNALYDSKKIKHILVRHEQGASHAADGYARATGKCGTVLVTSGPGATNTVTGIAAAYMDSVPLVVVCGQVPTNVLGTDAFQESDITGITMPVVKHSFLLKDATDIPRVVAQAYHIASTGRPGPVVIDVPSNIAKSLIYRYEYPREVIIDSYRPTLKGHAKQIKHAARELAAAKCPVILAGGGVIKSNASAELCKCVDLLNAPLTCTMLGKGAFPENDKHFIGVAGVQSSAVANAALQESDLLLAIGTRFADRVTGDTATFARGAKVIHIDIDPAEISKNIHADIPIVGDAKIVLQSLNEQLENANANKDRLQPWWQQICSWKDEQQKERAVSSETSQQTLTPREVLKTLSKLCAARKTIFTTEVGQHQMWAAHYLQCEESRTFLSSGGAGVMGYGLPAALGAAIGNKDAQVICIAGDGSLQMNIQEMATITELGLPVKVLLLNNKGLGMVHELQNEKFNSHYIATTYSFSPDFGGIAQAYGWQSFRIAKRDNLESCMNEWLSCKKAALLEVDISLAERTVE